MNKIKCLNCNGTGVVEDFVKGFCKCEFCQGTGFATPSVNAKWEQEQSKHDYHLYLTEMSYDEYTHFREYYRNQINSFRKLIDDYFELKEKYDRLQKQYDYVTRPDGYIAQLRWERDMLQDLVDKTYDREDELDD